MEIATLEKSLDANRPETGAAARAVRRSEVVLEVTQAGVRRGHGDAVGLLDAPRSHLQVRMERVRALAELASSQADLERAAGTLAVEGETPVDGARPGRAKSVAGWNGDPLRVPETTK